MERAFRVAVLFTSPGFGGDGGGIIITPTGVHRIPPWTPKVRETFEWTLDLYHYTREPGCWPGPPPEQYTRITKLSEHLLVELGQELAAGFRTIETGTSAVALVIYDYRTGNYTYVDAQGHVHHVVVDPRVIPLVSATATYLQAEQLHDAALAGKIQEQLTPVLKAAAAELSGMLVPA